MRMDIATTAKDLISRRVAVGFPEQRLAYLSEQIDRDDAQCCVVLEPGTMRLVGFLDFSDLAAHTGIATRILADLMQSPPALSVDSHTPVAKIETLFLTHGPREIAVLTDQGDYVGLITPESYCRWVIEQKRDS